MSWRIHSLDGWVDPSLHSSKKTIRVKLKITGMTRNHCRAAVHKALSGVDGAQHVEVDLAAGTAVVGGEPEPERLVTVVKDEGYGAENA